MNENLLLLARISQYSILIPFVASMVFNGRLDQQQRVIQFIVAASLVTEILATSLISLFDFETNHNIYNSFAVLQFVLVNRLYWHYFKQAISKIVSNLTLVLFLIFVAYEFGLNDEFQSLNSAVLFVGGISYIIYALTYYYNLLKIAKLISLENDPMFWYSTGLLLYNSGALFLLILIENITLFESKKVTPAAWLLNMVFNVMLNLFYLKALTLRKEGNK